VSSHPAAAIDGKGGKQEKKEGAGAPQIEKKTDESRLEAIKRKQKEREVKEQESAAAEKKKESEALVPAKKAKEKGKEKERDEHAATAPRKEDVSERTSGVVQYFCVFILSKLIHLCPHTTLYVSSYSANYYTCVRILLYMCPHTQ
jgi:hypothetical protein